MPGGMSYYPYYAIDSIVMSTVMPIWCQIPCTTHPPIPATIYQCCLSVVCLTGISSILIEPTSDAAAWSRLRWQSNGGADANIVVHIELLISPICYHIFICSATTSWPLVLHCRSVVHTCDQPYQCISNPLTHTRCLHLFLCLSYFMIALHYSFATICNVIES